MTLLGQYLAQNATGYDIVFCDKYFHYFQRFTLNRELKKTA
jgi:hypothetical protein